MKRRVQISRDSTLFFGGLLGVGYETLLTKGERPGLLFLFGAMMGLPAFLNRDDKKAAPPEPPPEPVAPPKPAAKPRKAVAKKKPGTTR